MGHGTPDWGVTAGRVTTYQLTDLAELAVRLGSIVTYDRRGDVVFLEDFRDGLHRWTATLVGNGAAADLSAAYARSGRYSARLVPGSTSRRVTEISHSLPMPAASMLGAEFSWTLPAHIESITLFSSVNDGAVGHEAKVRYVVATETLEIYVAGGAWQVVATGITPAATSGHFHTLKLVFDLDARKYVRLIYADSEIDLTAYDVEVGDFVVDPVWSIIVEVVGDANENAPVYVDDLILTQNEPA